MSFAAVVQALTKSDRRKDWVALKKKHEKALKKVTVDAGLGPALDKYQVQAAKISKLAAEKQLAGDAFAEILAAAAAVKTAASKYLTKVKGLGDPAEKELTAWLKSLETDCGKWDQAAKDFAANVKTLDDILSLLQGVESQVTNLTTRCPKVLTLFTKSLSEETVQFEMGHKVLAAVEPLQESTKLLAADLAAVMKLYGSKSHDQAAIKLKAMAAKSMPAIIKAMTPLWSLPETVAAGAPDNVADYVSTYKSSQTAKKHIEAALPLIAKL